MIIRLFFAFLYLVFINYANAELTSEEMERYSEKGIAQVYISAAEKFNELLIPGYASWASGGTPMEVISSAGSDIVLTLVGGKIVKVAWNGSKALYQGAKTLGRKLLIANKPMLVEIKPWRLAEIEAGKTLGLGAKPQIKYQFGRDVTGSNPKGGYVIPDFVDEARKACFEVKNYLLENRSSMISKIVEQAKKRSIHLPQGMQQKIIIDFRGPKASPDLEGKIRQAITEKSGGIISPENVRFVP